MTGKYGRERPYYGNKAPAVRVLESQVLEIADFTDGDSTTGYIDVETTLPIGAIPIAWKIDVLSAFANTAVFTGNPANLAFVDGDASADTITTDEVEYSFVDDGFEDGDSIVIAGATTEANDGTYIITTVAAGTLTFATAQFNTGEDGIADMTMIGISTATVSIGIAGSLARFTADATMIATAVGSIGSATLAADACDGIATAQTIRLTITEGTDFSEYDTGAMKLYLYYIETI